MKLSSHKKHPIIPQDDDNNGRVISNSMLHSRGDSFTSSLTDNSVGKTDEEANDTVCLSPSASKIFEKTKESLWNTLSVTAAQCPNLMYGGTTQARYGNNRVGVATRQPSKLSATKAQANRNLGKLSWKEQATREILQQDDELFDDRSVSDEDERSARTLPTQSEYSNALSNPQGGLLRPTPSSAVNRRLESPVSMVSNRSYPNVIVGTGLETQEDIAHCEINPPQIRNSHTYATAQRQHQSSNRLGEPSNLSSIPESRIVAPNVSRLTPGSCVEIRLQAEDTCVAILCSVDVLKMRSVFFHDILEEQDNVHFQTSTIGGMTASGSSYGSEKDIWRQPIIVPESSPFEAAAFLECMHEIRSSFKEWNYCWARLSIYWNVPEVARDYAAQADAHISHILTFLRERHWRATPNVLNGLRVAVLKKATVLAAPHIATGRIHLTDVLVSIPSSGNSVGGSNVVMMPRIRVVFDEPPPSTSNCSVSPSGSVATPIGSCISGGVTTPVVTSTPIAASSPVAQSRRNLHSHVTPGQAPCPNAQSASYSRPGNVSNTSSRPVPFPASQSSVLNVGDAVEPFWVQRGSVLPNNGNDTKSGSVLTSISSPSQAASPSIVASTTSDILSPTMAPLAQGIWLEPDTYCTELISAELKSSDKKMFWEMIRVMIELEEFRAMMKGPLKSSEDLTNVLMKKENKLLWASDAAEHIPKDCATALMIAAYVIQD